MATLSPDRVYVPALGREINRRCGNGHDMSSPDSMRVYCYGGKLKWQCKQCTTDRLQKCRKLKVSRHPIPCEFCGALFQPRTITSFCTPHCRGKFAARSAKENGIYREASHFDVHRADVEEFLQLCDKRDRETRAWIRAELDAEVDVMRARL